jgi:hypothetical protein
MRQVVNIHQELDIFDKRRSVPHELYGHSQFFQENINADPVGSSLTT